MKRKELFILNYFWNDRVNSEAVSSAGKEPTFFAQDSNKYFKDRREFDENYIPNY